MRLHLLSAFLFSTALLTRAAWCGSISTSGSSGGGVVIPGIVMSGSTGGDMTGMLVSITHAGPGGTDSCLWAATGPLSGGCATALFSIAQTGDTFTAPSWTLSSTPTGFFITSIRFDGLPGHTVFDRATGGIGTPGSDLGADATGTTPIDPADGFASYLTPVSLMGLPSSGDIFASVKIDFTGFGVHSAVWLMDTDRLEIPEPGTGGLLLAAALVAVCRRRRRLGSS